MSCICTSLYLAFHSSPVLHIIFFQQLPKIHLKFSPITEFPFIKLYPCNLGKSPNQRHIREWKFGITHLFGYNVPIRFIALSDNLY